ncbi:MAG: 3-isopropylmalate dehydrogenase [Gammaproteobacteria bacterium]|nr:MAG: 3-isopropylmalate dehydrogenase [Gammaproteobacteria bacterium]
MKKRIQHKQTHQPKIYQWRGRDRDGTLRKSEITAANEQIVRAYLQKQGIVPTTIIEKPRALFETQGKIKTLHIVSFSRKMATMLKAGLSIVQSLDLIAEGTQQPKQLYNMIVDIKNDVESGNSFSSALSNYPSHFNPLYTALVAAGEEAGVLDKTMDNIANNLEKSQRLKKKVKKAMIYPGIVITAAIIVTTVLLIKVIPAFESFYDDFNAELPMLTQSVLSFSRMLRQWGWMVILGFFIGVLFFFWLKKRHPPLQRWADRTSLHLPILGHILRLSAMSRFARTLAVLFNAGIPLVKSLKATAPATGNSVYEAATQTIAKDVENGVQLNFAMQNTGQFQPFAIQMTSIGEESGNLHEMLSNIAEFYEEELDYRIEQLTTLLEPVMIILLALIVGILVIAMYLPIFTLGNVIG